MPEAVKLIIRIILIIISIVLIVLVLLQQGKNNGISGLSGQISNTYWGKNKGRSQEGRLKKLTAFLIAALCICALLLSVQFPDTKSNANTADHVTEASESILSTES